MERDVVKPVKTEYTIHFIERGKIVSVVVLNRLKHHITLHRVDQKVHVLNKVTSFVN